MLQKPTVKIRAVNEDKLTIVGGFVAEIEGDGPDGTIVSCRAMVQVSNSISGFYVSQDTLISLGVIDESFPTVGSRPVVEIGTMCAELPDC